MTCGTSRGVREINDGHDLQKPDKIDKKLENYLKYFYSKRTFPKIFFKKTSTNNYEYGTQKVMIKIEGESEFRRPEGASGTGRDDHNRGEEASWFIRRESQKSERDCRNLSDK